MLSRRIKSEAVETAMFATIRVLSFAVLAFLVFILGFIISRGYSALSWEFISGMPRDEMTAGGIFPALLGTFYLMIGSALVSIPIGIITAIYLTEYSRRPALVKLIRLGVSNLAGVPSVVFGLFGLALFVVFLDFGTSILAGSLTLGILNLPVIIRSTEEALMTVPGTYREASLSLGATRLQTIFRIVLPNAMPGILTGVMLSLGRAAGETAPIMFTAASYYAPELPASIFDQVMALPYHIYVMATAGTHITETRPIQYGTAIILILLVLALNSIGLVLRYRFRKRMKG
ncbi:MAG TPA: phosphate ABC transporter permease PstA [Spirochaetota bacterium]|nr:phosphate ABC transporter permease PstA [Spirochaetota bacterium]HOD16506.1 phosphate ABC transporter permease PstA [Spirochaetota bacterium]HPG50135.1 phosphate ABC transporter permease PstA [Spirochaetota bacterium]HPN10917.1 phosphate ABC transporter permease PstA [Spirochaetota bacterium]HQL81982.1 phosphate ABC transporter permease PstA [Spirochaetota bacterium]